MSAHNDIAYIQRRINTLTRAATDLSRHLPELHALAYDAHRTDTEPDRAGFESRPPPGWRAEPTRAHQLWDRIRLEIGRCEDILVNLDRELHAAFYAGTTNAAPSRGSLISAAEHQRLLANQRARSDAPARLVDQPNHPAAGHATPDFLWTIALILVILVMLRMLGAL